MDNRDVNAKPRRLRILIAEDTERDTELILATLRRAGYSVSFDVVDSLQQFQAHLEQSEYDAVLSDHNLRTWTGNEGLEMLRQSGKDIPFIVVTGSLGDETAVEYVKKGAADYVLKHRMEQLPVAVGQALSEKARRSLEEQLRQAQKMEAIGQLASGIAHDFNNMLGIILGYSDLLLEQPSLVGQDRARMAEIKTAATRAAEITRQLLAFSRKQVLETRILDLNALVSEACKMLSRLIGDDIEVTTRLGPELWSVQADPAQLQQIVLNLAVNARDAMPHGGKLTIETTNAEIDGDYGERHVHVSPGNYVLLAITDTGTGMDAETQKHIFEPFFTTKRGRGTGLGLSMVYGIVKQSGGYVWVYSEPGHGTAFKIYLPRIEGVAAPLPANHGEAAPTRGSETVLLVEDDAALRELNRELLQGLGYQVLTAAHGAEAVKLAANPSPAIQLLMTDVVMPGMNGRELAEQLQRDRPALKILYVSGYTENVIAPEILREGTAFLQKPFARDLLAKKMRELLDGGS